MSRQNQQGGIFFYILLAITLLAGLTYVISQNNRGNSNIITDEQARIAAQEIIDYGNTVANAVQKLRLRGVKEYEIDYTNNIFKLENGTPWPATNATCTSDVCKLFNISGGGIEPKYAPEAAKIPAVPSPLGSSSGIGSLRTNVILGVGSSEVDVNFEYTYINREVCLKINELLGITNPAGEPPVDNYSGGMENYTGTLTSVPEAAGAAANPIGDDVPELTGKNAFCLSSTLPYYSYKQVVIAR